MSLQDQDHDENKEEDVCKLEDGEEEEVINSSLVRKEEVSDDKEEEISSNSNDDDDDDDDDSFSSYCSSREEEVMPFFKYARVHGSLPRGKGVRSNSIRMTNNDYRSNNHNDNTNTNTNTNSRLLESECCCSTMGRVVMSIHGNRDDDKNNMESPNGNLFFDNNNAEGSNSGSNINNNNDSNNNHTNNNNYADVQNVVAMGFRNGSVQLINPLTGGDTLLMQRTKLSILPPTTNIAAATIQKVSPVVQVRFDATGTIFAAMTSSGDVAIFEFQYGFRPRPINPNDDDNYPPMSNTPNYYHTNNPNQQLQNSVETMFGSFLSKLAGDNVTSSNMNQNSSSHNSANLITKHHPTQNATNFHNNHHHRTNVKYCLSIVNHPIPVTRLSYRSNRGSSTSSSSTSLSMVGQHNNNSIVKCTCMVLDPAYKRKRDKPLAVGFSDGRIIITKQGTGLFGRRNDITIYQGSIRQSMDNKNKNKNRQIKSNNSSTYGGIEALEWRGVILASADESGIKLYDTENMTRIAHIDRPTGARASLYPTISDLRPTLLFEQSESLLIAWGDCIVTIHIKENKKQQNNNITNPLQLLQQNQNNNNTHGQNRKDENHHTNNNATSSSNNNANNNPTSSSIVDRRVQCGSAWQLDGVAVGAVPMDKDHIAILLLHPNHPDDDEHASSTMADHEEQQQDHAACKGLSPSGNNTLELQIICRDLGTAISSDALPLLYPKNNSDSKLSSSVSYSASGARSNSTRRISLSQRNMTWDSDSATQYMFLSSYCTPRMEDYIEVLQEEDMSSNTTGNENSLNQNNNDNNISTSGLGGAASTENNRSSNINNSNNNSNMGFDLEKEILDAMTATFQQNTIDPKQKRFIDYHLRWDLKNIHQDCSTTDDNTTIISQSHPKEKDNSSPLEKNAFSNPFNDDIDDENKEETKYDGYDDESTSSVDSDDYSFLFYPSKENIIASHSLETKGDETSTFNRRSSFTTPPQNKKNNNADPPFMFITSHHDAVLVQTRDLDDSVSHARLNGNHGLALKRALKHRHKMQRHSIDQLIDEYLSAVLCLTETNNEIAELSSVSTILTIRRLKLAARTTPILLGINVSMWERWVHEFAKIPGGLFVLRPYIPIRDPILPKPVYEMVLENMFNEVESILTKEEDNDDNISMVMSNHVIFQNPSMTRAQKGAVNMFLRTLRGWGPRAFMRERLKLDQFYRKECGWQANFHKDLHYFDVAIEELNRDLNMRTTQSASVYLQYPIDIREFDARFGLETSSMNQASNSTNVISTTSNNVSVDALFDVKCITKCLLPRIVPKTIYETKKSPFPREKSKISAVCALALEAMAELSMMEGNYKDALKYYLLIGAHFMMLPLSSIEDNAVESVNREVLGNKARVDESELSSKSANKSTYNKLSSFNRFRHVLPMIESHQMFNCLLDESFLASGFEDEKLDSICILPLVALIRLVGLERCGWFLIEHSVLTVSSLSTTSTTHTSNNENMGTMLPINIVSGQFRTRPKLMHWYLHNIFIFKPEIYVKFPNTAVPPRAITDLHRIHLELHVEYANREDRNRKLADVPTYDEMAIESPLMAFLKAALPHGGVRSDEVRRILEDLRLGRQESSSPDKKALANIGNIKYPYLFSSELAYVIERAGSGTEDDAKSILFLYLDGSKSLPLAVSYAERNTMQSEMLWDLLISYCLNSSSNEESKVENGFVEADGILFGSLLEVASRLGADLSNLVSKIPTGMRIEGIRPKLVSAISDYRLKLKIHEASCGIMGEDKIDLLRDLSHRSRRGFRVEHMGTYKQNISEVHDVSKGADMHLSSGGDGWLVHKKLWHHRKNEGSRGHIKHIPIR